MYYNTNDLFGEALADVKQKALNQDDLVLNSFKYLDMPLTPSLVHKYLINRGSIDSRTPLTSIRRSFSDLTKEGKLTKTEKKVKGQYGLPEHQWRLNKD